MRFQIVNFFLVDFLYWFLYNVFTIYFFYKTKSLTDKNKPLIEVYLYKLFLVFVWSILEGKWILLKIINQDKSKLKVESVVSEIKSKLENYKKNNMGTELNHLALTTKGGESYLMPLLYLDYLKQLYIKEDLEEAILSADKLFFSNKIVLTILNNLSFCFKVTDNNLDNLASEFYSFKLSQLEDLDNQELNLPETGSEVERNYQFIKNLLEELNSRYESVVLAHSKKLDIYPSVLYCTIISIVLFLLEYNKLVLKEQKNFKNFIYYQRSKRLIKKFNFYRNPTVGSIEIVETRKTFFLIKKEKTFFNIFDQVNYYFDPKKLKRYKAKMI